MMTFLFWNASRAPANLIGRLVAEHRVDVLILAESRSEEAAVLREIRSADGANFHADPIRDNVAIYTRFDGRHLGHEYEEPHMSMRRIGAPPGDVLLVAVHLRSKASTSRAEQAALAPGYAFEIRRTEDKLGHRRTLLVGDLNMDPFEDGMVQMSGFHAIPSHRIATERGKANHKGERMVDGKYYPFFYNPMWNCFGDERGGPPGSYFRDKADPIAYFWHLYDQVLVRPSLVDRFLHQELKILTDCGPTPLLNGDGQPDRDAVSDHLPIRFRLDLDLPGANP